MRFLEYETWRLKKDCPMDAYENMIETWFRYVVEKKKELFEEWVSAKYYTRCDHEGNPTGVFVMLFEYESLEGHHAYKSRKLRSYEVNDGVYAQYAANDPYQFFDLEHVEILCMQPLKTDFWFDYTEEKRAIEKANGVELRRFLEYETWRVAPDAVWEDYEKMIETWFTYVVEQKKALFDEWVSARYYQQCDKEGNPTGVYVMLFEYDSLEGHHAYKSRKLHSYALNDGVYATYASNDPYQFFDLDHVHIDCMQPLRTDLWFDYSEEKEAEGK